jgi:hypothetical protein
MEKERADWEGTKYCYSRHFGYECKDKKGKDGGELNETHLNGASFSIFFHRPPLETRKSNLFGYFFFWQDPHSCCWLRKARVYVCDVGARGASESDGGKGVLMEGTIIFASTWGWIHNPHPHPHLSGKQQLAKSRGLGTFHY